MKTVEPRRIKKKTKQLPLCCCCSNMEKHNGLDPPESKKEHKVIFPIWIYLYSATASFMSFTFGFNSAIVAAALVFIPNINMAEAAAIVSVMLFGALLGSLSAGSLADLLGRKPALLCNYIFAFLAALGSALAMASWQLILWRFIIGFGVGAASVIPALYITETCPGSIRGMQSTGNQLAGSLGIVVAYFVGATIITCDTRECWRWMFGSGVLLSILGFTGTCLIPESPRWLLGVKKDRERVLAVLKKIYGALNEAELKNEYHRMCDQINTSGQKDETARWRDIARRQYRKPLLVSSCLLPLLQALSGNTTLVYYTALLLTTLGVPKGKAVLYTALSGLPQPVMLVLVLFLMDRVGRKILLLASIAGSAIATLTLGLLLFFSSSTAKKELLLAAIILFRIFYALGLGPVPQVLGPEMLPFAIRARGTAISLAVYWMTVGIITALFPPLLRLIPPYAFYWFFTAVLAFGLFLSLNYVRETKAKSLEEIESMHQLPIIAPDGSNRNEIPKDSLISKFKPVTVIMPPPSPPIQ